jgi:hypothetical protein
VHTTAAIAQALTDIAKLFNAGEISKIALGAYEDDDR